MWSKNYLSSLIFKKAVIRFSITMPVNIHWSGAESLWHGGGRWDRDGELQDQGSWSPCSTLSCSTDIYLHVSVCFITNIKDKYDDRIKANSSFICIIFDHLHATFVANSILMYTTLTSIWLKLKFATDRQPWWRSLQDESSPMWFGIAWRYSYQHLHHHQHHHHNRIGTWDLPPEEILRPRTSRFPSGNLSGRGAQNPSP